MEALVIQMISGAVGGNIAGGILKNFNLGVLGNSISGIIGGGLGGQVLAALGIGVSANGIMDMGSILGTVASGGVGGGIVMLVIGLVRKMMSK